MSRSRGSLKLVLLLLVALLVAAFFAFDLGRFLTLAYLKEQQSTFRAYYEANQLQTIAIYFVVYVAATALSLPGATILTLAGGALFGLGVGLLIVSFASSLGATLAFLVSRYVAKDTVQSRFGDKLRAINEGIAREGAFYLFTLRLIPLFPFFVINLVMGLTPMRAWTFYVVSQLGMLAGTAVYVNAGTQIASLESAAGIVSPKLLLSFALLGIFPLIAKSLIGWQRARKALSKWPKPKRFDYNLVVIGGGSAGLVTSYIAAAVKAKVALIEQHKMGGDCLNTGCVPSKALIKTAKLVAHARRAEALGLRPMTADFDFAAVMERVQRVVKTVEPHDSVDRYTKLGVECLTGRAVVKSPWEVDFEGRRITAKNIVVATGAAPVIPRIDGLGGSGAPVRTSEDIWDIRELPKRLVVLGGGPIGCELAQCFARLGAKVTLVEMQARLMGREDDDVAEFVKAKFQSEGIEVLTGYKAARAQKAEGAWKLVCEAASGGGAAREITFDLALAALGRKARVEGFGLEELGIRLGKGGTVEADPLMRTTIPTISVAGDVTGPYQFTHVAAHQAWYAAVNSLFAPFKSFKVDYRVIPWVTYVDPEVARVGLSERDAKEKGIAYEKTEYNLDDLDRAIADEEAHGFVKVLTVPGKDKILGVTAVGDHAGDWFIEFVTAMKYGIGLNKILGTIHPYPTWAEANKYAAGNWKKAHAPEGALKMLAKFHAWRRGAVLAAAIGAGALAGTPSARAAEFDQTHALWNDVLKSYQTETGHMRYKTLAADLKAKPDHALVTYLKAVDEVAKKTYDAWPDNAKKAFLMNAYNAHTVKLIADNYPVKSIKDLGSLFKSPWKKELFSMLDGKIKTLDGIEQDTLRPDFKDARIHSAVNCASISCPRLAPVALTADALDAQLDALMKGWLADPTRNRYEPAKGKLFLSKIFDWYGEDFERSYGSVAKAVEKFGPKEAAEALAKGGSIDYLDYDWNLNEAP